MILVHAILEKNIKNVVANNMKLKWQDIIISIACIGFAYALIPQIIYCHEIRTVDIEWQTIIINVICLITMAICMGTLNFWFTMSSNIATCICWAILLIQKIIY